MTSKKTLLITSAIAIFGLSTLLILHTNATYAASNSTNIIDQLVERFSLNRDEVQTVFNENHANQIANRQQIMQDRLGQAVADNQLTQTQSDQISTKLSEINTLDDSLKDKTFEERRAAMQTKMDELRQWAEENNIPPQYLSIGMRGPHGGFGPRMGTPMHNYNR